MSEVTLKKTGSACRLQACGWPHKTEYEKHVILGFGYFPLSTHLSCSPDEARAYARLILTEADRADGIQDQSPELAPEKAAA